MQNEYGEQVEICAGCGDYVEVIAAERGGSRFFIERGGKVYHPWCAEGKPTPTPRKHFCKTCPKCGGEVKEFSHPYGDKMEKGHQCIRCEYNGSYLV